MDNNQKIRSFDRETVLDHIGRTKQAKYLVDYLNSIDAKTFIDEEGYIDKTYLVDYQKFYSRSWTDWGKKTNRVHFFSKKFTSRKLKFALKNNKLKFFQESYLGFIVVKPIEDIKGNRLIGRTVLKTYPKKTGNNTRYYIKKKYAVSLFGIILSVESSPFQSQDRGVAACATVALWTAFQTCPNHFDLNNFSPAEITEMSTEIPSYHRIFPQFGLTLGQMINCIHIVGLDAEVLLVKDDPEIINTAIKAYSHAKIPVICDLKVKKPKKEKKSKEKILHHAVVVTGYQHNINNQVLELYVHDDQTGPYSRIEPSNNFQKWKNDWTEKGYEIECEKLLVPIYHKIRLPFTNIYNHYKKMKKKLAKTNFHMDLYLTTIQEYKSWLLKHKLQQKVDKLITQLPRLIWIERTTEKGKTSPAQDDIFDGTSINVKEPLTRIYYESE